MPESIWRYFLEDNPAIAFQALRPQGGPYSFLDYWRGQEGNIWNQYQGQLGQTALSGLPPTLNYTDFLQGYPWLQRYLGLPPEERGERRSLYAPRLQWLL